MSSATIYKKENPQRNVSYLLSEHPTFGVSPDEQKGMTFSHMVEI